MWSIRHIGKETNKQTQAEAPSGEKILKEATLIFLLKDGKILLPLKTRKIGAGCRNGYGGGIEEGEDLILSALRELHEESGVRGNLDSLEKVAELCFENTTEEGRVWNIIVHTFFCRAWKGEVVPTEEMADPKWYLFEEIPENELMTGTHEWLKLALSGKKIIVRAKHGPHQKTLLSPQVIDVVEGFD